MRFVSIHLLAAALTYATLIAATPALAEDSVAVEIIPTEPVAAETDATSTDAEESVATEVTPLEKLSFRETFSLPQAEAAEAEGIPTLQPVDPVAQLGQTVQTRCEEITRSVVIAEQALSLVSADPLAVEQVREYFTPQLEQARGELAGLDEQLLNELAAQSDPVDPAHVEVTGWRDELSQVIARVDECMVSLAAVEPEVYNETKAGFSLGLGTQEPTNQVFEETVSPRYQQGGILTSPTGCGPVKEKSEWEIEGEVGVGTGTATYADQEFQEFELSETLITPRGHEYEFFQAYEVDHSYVNSGELIVGAEQRFEELLWAGDLKLTEEFVLYRDRDDPLNDRQEGEFRLRFYPEWCDGRWQADLDYKYKVRAYETFSERSYILHQTRVQLEHEFSEQLTGDVEARLADYNYSIGSTRSNHRLGLSTDWEWEPSDSWRLTAGASQDEKTYDVRRSRSYERVRYQGSVRWTPDDASTVELKGELTDYDRVYAPSRSYEDTRFELRLKRDVTEQLELEGRVTERKKDYDIDPLDDLDQHGLSLGANFNPDQRWNFYARLDTTDYDYARDVRAFTQDRVGAGLRYSYGDVRATMDWRRTENSYQAATDRDYSRDDFDIDLGYGFDDHRVRVYYGIGQLQQAHPASVNEYTETRLGAEWRYEFDPQAELRLSYDLRERDYDVQDTIKDALLEARLLFEF